jgi:hypothetical protein
MTYKCIKKVRDKNNIITAYWIQSSDGKISIVKSENLKSMIENNQVIISNLTLTSDYRLIDSGKEANRENTNTNKTDSNNISDFIPTVDRLDYYLKYCEQYRQEFSLSEIEKRLSKYKLMGLTVPFKYKLINNKPFITEVYENAGPNFIVPEWIFGFAFDEIGEIQDKSGYTMKSPFSNIRGDFKVTFSRPLVLMSDAHNVLKRMQEKDEYNHISCGLFMKCKFDSIELKNCFPIFCSCSYMFKGCPNLIKINLGNIETRVTRGIDLMFSDCEKLEEVNLGTRFNVEHLESNPLCFKNSPNMKKVILEYNKCKLGNVLSGLCSDISIEIKNS